jgi:hypothetical protein
LLALEPEHQTAKHGFKEIAERFVVLAEKEFSRRNYPKAQIYTALGLQVDVESKALHELQFIIDNRERSLTRHFFKSISLTEMTRRLAPFSGESSKFTGEAGVVCCAAVATSRMPCAAQHYLGALIPRSNSPMMALSLVRSPRPRAH